MGHVGRSSKMIAKKPLRASDGAYLGSIFALQKFHRMAALASHECFLQSARGGAPGAGVSAGGPASEVQPGAALASPIEGRLDVAWRGSVNGAVQTRDIMSKSNQSCGVLLCMTHIVRGAKPRDYRRFFCEP